MQKNRLQDILPYVHQPSRYLGSEINRIQKNHRDVDIKIALAFPDLYEIGTSHFGLQILYSILNSRNDIVAERVFAPAPDMEKALRDHQRPLLSLESQKPLTAFDIVGFSLLYELNYTNILTMLDLSNLPFFADKRDGSSPIIIAGGPCTCNPEPIAEFFDAMVIGDGEEVIIELADAWLAWRKKADAEKQSLLKAWSSIRGVYVPSFYHARYSASGHQLPGRLQNGPQIVKRAVVADIDAAPFPSTPIVPFGKPVHDRLRMEIARGCTRGCRFCQAGMIYRPVRERSLVKLTELSEKSLRSTGYEDISLLSLSTGDYSAIEPLLDGLMNRCDDIRTAVSLPSLRIGSLSPQLMEMIRKVRKTGFTFAPEAGSQRLRDVINKNISENDIEKTVADAFRLGWRVVKLYFMIGLPTETIADLQQIVDLVKRLSRFRSLGARHGKLNVSLTTFVPKPHTPFQWAPQLTIEASQQRIHWLRERLSIRGVHVKYQHPAVSQIEGLWARGDRRLSQLLVNAYYEGCRLDGWTDHFDFERWASACHELGIQIENYTNRCRDIDDPLPWDHVDIGVSKQFLVDEWHNALDGSHTEDCRFGQCNQCGVCDFYALAPVYGSMDARPATSLPTATTLNSGVSYQTIQLTFSKLDQARFLGHLELVNIFIRALRRAGIPMKYTEGFHPKPKLSFKDALPVGIESEQELLNLSIPTTVPPEGIPTAINAHLPDGLRVSSCQPNPLKSKRNEASRCTYIVFVDAPEIEPSRIDWFFQQPHLRIHKQTKRKRRRTIDLREMVQELKMLSGQSIQVTLQTGQNGTVRPDEILRQIFQLSENIIRAARITKKGCEQIYVI